jgi:uncharacterized small protein (DUF1192 family)
LVCGNLTLWGGISPPLFFMMKERVWKINLTKGGNKETYYEPQKLPREARNKLSLFGWEIKERIVGVDAEIRRLNPEEWSRHAAKIKGGSSLTFNFQLFAGRNEKLIDAVMEASNGRGNLLS